MKPNKTLKWLMLSTVMIAMFYHSSQGQCNDPSQKLTINRADKDSGKVHFTMQADPSVTSADLSISYLDGGEWKTNNKQLNLSNGQTTDSITFTGNPAEISLSVTYIFDGNYCYLSESIDLACQNLNTYQDDGLACNNNYQKMITLIYNNYSSDDTATAILKHRGVKIDSLILNPYTWNEEKTYTFANIGFDTLEVTYRKQFCERTEQVPILISGDCSNFSCDADLQIEESGINKRKITINHPVASLYHWSLYSPYGTDTLTTNSKTREFTLAANTLYSVGVYAIDPINWCYTNKNTTITTSPCYADLSVGNYGTSAYFTINVLADNNYTYTLSFGDGKDTIIQIPSNSAWIVYDYDTSGGKRIFTAVLTVKDSLGNTCNVISKEVSFEPCQTKFFSYTGNTPLEEYFYLSLSINTWYSAIRYVLDFGDGQQYTDSTSGWPGYITHQYASPGTYTVKLFAEFYQDNAVACSDAYTANVIVGTTPLAADFSYQVDNNTFKFFDNSVGVITNYQWDFGDGNTSSTQNPTHTYTTEGIYQVCLTVKNEAGHVNTLCKEIVYGTPGCLTRASFMYSSNPSYPLKIAFYNLSTGATNYYWDFGDGNTSVAKDPTHTYAKMGIYNVKLAAYSEDCYNVYNQTIRVGSISCLAQFAHFINISTGEVTVSNTSIAGENAVYFWNFGDGTFNTTANPPVKSYTKDGKYTIGLLVYDPTTACYDYFEQNVYINRSCKAQFSYAINPTTRTIQLQNTSLNANKYYWFFSDGSYSTDVHPTHTFNAAGIHKVSLTVANTVTGCLDSHEEYITIGNSADCEADFTYRIEPSTNQVFLYDQSKGNITQYLWNFGNGTTSVQQNPTVTYTKPGAYNVCLTVVSAGGISNLTCKNVITSANTCVADYDYLIEPGRKVYFNETSLGNPVNYQWNFGDNAQASGRKVNHTYAANGYYLTSLKISNGSTCNSAAYQLINVGMPGKLKAGIIALQNNGSKKAGGYPVDFIGAGLGDDVRIKWTFGDGTEDTTTTSPTHVYSAPGTYTACYIVSDPITGQADTACTIVTVTDISQPTLASDNLQVYPVPFNDQLMVAVSLKQASKVQISLYDLSGRNIVLSNHNVALPGNIPISLSTAHIKPGTYMLKVDIGGQKFTRMVVKQ